MVTLSRHLRAAATDHQRHLLAHPEVQQRRVPVEAIPNGARSDSSDHVAAPEASALGRRPGHDAGHRRAANDRFGRVVGSGLLEPNTDPRAPNASVRQQVLGDAARTVDRDGEAEADRAAAARGVDRRVDADHLARRADERAARVAGIDRGVRLDHVEVGRRTLSARHEVAADAADHARRHARLGVAEHESVRVADGDRPLADEQVVAVAERRHRQTARPHLEYREVVRLVGADCRSWIGRSVTEHHRDAGRAGDDVRVRDDDAVPAHDEPRAETRLGLRAGSAAEQRVERIRGDALHDLGLNRHHRGRDARHCLGDGGAPRGGHVDARLVRGARHLRRRVARRTGTRDDQCLREERFR